MPLDAVAIVGMACRFPGAPDVATFWRNLCAGVKSIRVFSDAELRQQGVDERTLGSASFVKAGALLEDAGAFDAGLFGFTKREAEILDPQHRLFFECVWEALEDAGYDPLGSTGPVGLFGGTSINTYLLYNLAANHELLDAVGPYQICIANDKDSLTTHVAYKLNLRGPCVTVQTACSTSLVAVQLAYQSLLTFQCDMALAGGVSVRVPHTGGYYYQEGAIASPDGHCRAFDAEARGTVGGSGVGVVALKRLEDALAEGDRIVAVIRGAAVNNDGSLKVGYTAPSADGQADVVALAQAVAAVMPDSIGYIEAHGTGTPLGDPIEVAALTRVFRATTDRRGFCALGAVKANIGHLDAAAGIAGLIKAALVVEQGVIPTAVSYARPNPALRLEESPFYVPTATTPWPGRGPRRAGVSSFGIGGTNAHVVLEQPPDRPDPAPARRRQILTISARTEERLDALAARLAEHLGEHPEQDLADVGYTLQTGRRALACRLAVACDDRLQAIDALATREGDRTSRGPAATGVAYLFPGQGAQAPGMGAGLYDAEPVFRAEVDRCCAMLAPRVGFDLRDLLLTSARDPEAAARLTETAVAQPALFVVEYALATLWMKWGVGPAAMIGHSLGEYVAACLAGVFSIEDALALVAARGRLMQSAAPGAMLAVALPEDDAARWLGEGLSLAAINGAEACVIAGSRDAVTRLEQTLAGHGIAGRRLNTSHAFHSASMDPVLDAFGREVARVPLRPPMIPLVSNLTGRWMSDEQATAPAYWVEHLRRPVRFADGLATLLGEGGRIPLEVGPGGTLAGLCRRLPGHESRPPPIASWPTGQDRRSEIETVLDAAGSLWTAGVAVDWRAFHSGMSRRRVALPTYPFERTRYWVEPPSRTVEPASDWYSVPEWRRGARTADGPPGAIERAIVFVDDGGAGAGFAAFLRSGGAAVFEVRQGPASAFTTDAPWVVPETREGYAELIAHFRRSGGVPPVAYHFSASFSSLLWIVQAIGSAPLKLFVVTSGLMPVQDTVLSGPGRAAALGPCLVAPQELPNIQARLIDLDPSDLDTDRLWRPLLAAEVAQDGNQPLVAYRRGVRWIRDFRPVSLPLPDPSWSRLTRGGVYWITGGTGGMGLAFATFLRESYDARLVLTSRTPRVDLAARALGPEVLVLAADVTDLQAMRAAAATARERFGRIDGLIHAAGVPGGGVVPLKTRAAAEAIMAPKIAGVEVIESLAAELPLDFIVLCSSIASLQGGFGQVDYAAANAVLDAFASYHTQKSGIPTIAINWDAWTETGMAVEATGRLRARAGASPDRSGPPTSSGLTTVQGIDAFRRALGSGYAQVVVSTIGLAARIERHRDAASVLREAGGGGSAPVDPGLEAGTPARAGHLAPEIGAESIERQIAGIWERVLGIADIGRDDNFFELGGDSLAGVQVIAHANAHFHLKIPVARFFEAPTTGALAALVRAESGPGDRPSRLAVDSERGAERRARHARRSRT